MVMNLSQHKIMGILNVTPDSFSDGGEYVKIGESVLRIREMINDGATIIDIGAESTGPGSEDVTAEEELRRLRPLIDFIDDKELYRDAVFSIDTYKAEVAEYALKSGFQIVNDVTAMRGDTRMVEVLVNYQPYIVLMYSKDSTPRTTTNWREYDDVVETVIRFLSERIEILLTAGFPHDKIIIDPGMGAFVSANPKYSFELIDRLDELSALGCPILVGVSRKSFLGGEVGDRDLASVKWSIEAIRKGASMVRVHNTKLLSERLNSVSR